MKSPSFWLLLGMVTSMAEQGRGGEWVPLQLSSWWPGKAGRCPAGSAQQPLPSKLYCLSDASCPGHEKCCILGWMRICVQPALGKEGCKGGRGCLVAPPPTGPLASLVLKAA
uniref:WAP domain-containing protein n=1 Tax=Pseudonaja textilis TaxID=8673 RepID=A0A670ZM75_PSETE